MAASVRVENALDTGNAKAVKDTVKVPFTVIVNYRSLFTLTTVSNFIALFLNKECYFVYSNV